jgi:hypothetical protein
MVAQQTRRTLREAVTEAPCSGEAHSVADLVGAVDAQESDGRDRRNIENVPKNSRRWVVFPTQTESGQYIDKVEKLQKAMDPTSVYVRTHTLAVQRGIGDKILGVEKQPDGTFKIRAGGILGTATDGKAPGSATVALPSGNIIAAGGTGLTLAKLKTSKEKLALREFGLEDEDEMYCAISPKQVTDLLDLADGDGTSLNAFQQLQLMNGKPTSLLGYTWIVTNRLPLDTNGDRMCPVWSRRNIVAGIWQDVEGAMWNDTSAKNTPYAHVGAFVDVVRAEDGGVEVITCVE